MGGNEEEQEEEAGPVEEKYEEAHPKELGRRKDRAWVGQLKKRLLHGRGRERDWRGLRKDKHGEMTAAAMGGDPQREQSKPRGNETHGRESKGRGF